MAGPISGIAGVPTGPEAPKAAPAEESKAAPAPQAPPADDFLSALLDKITPVGDSKPAPLKMLIYSEPGCGKTTLEGQIPGNLIIDTEKGRITLDENKKHNPDLVAEDVNILPYKSMEGLVRTIKALHDAPPQLDHVKAFTIDTLNNLHKRALAEITEREHDKNPIDNNRFVPKTEDYTEVNEVIRRLCQLAVDLDRHVIFMAHSKTVEPKGKPAKTFPDFSEKLANTVAAMVDVVGYMYMTEIDGEVKRVIKFKPSSGVTAKSRLTQLPDNMIDPTWEKIWNAYVN